MKKFTPYPLAYASDALEPYISRQTVELHYGVHTKTYFENLNKLLENTDYGKLELNEIICSFDSAIFNNAAQAWNHVFYFEAFSPKGGGQPTGRIADAIKKQFGSFEEFQKRFVEQGAGIFGSGWIWLARDFEGRLFIVPKQNAGNPMTDGLTPLLVFDVWEHAYYLDYQNRRMGYLNALWNIVDWSVIEERF